ncbi:MAG: hypothetical protein BGO31_09790 [Bacteroidetes bacterium 43-16]|nr:MAG: hypothetical protein BGO31_09790 [Bacteroidetes bacterium 43-16]
MVKGLSNFLMLIVVLLFNSNCNEQNVKENKSVQKENATVIVPFLPGDCHQCNEGFYKNLKILDARKVEYSFLLPDEFSEDLNYIKKEYKLEGYKNHQFIFSSALFNKYRAFQQTFVLQFGSDANYRTYNNATELIRDLELIGTEEKMTFGSYNVKKTTATILVKNNEQMYFQSSVQTNAFDYLDLKNKKQAIKIVFTDEQLLNNYILNFKDSSIAKSKLNEIKSITDIPNKDKFEQFELVKDTLFVSSYHTYISNIADSLLGGFISINIYKGGIYAATRPINSERIPIEYSIIPKFHVYKNRLYIEVVKNQLASNKPNYFLAEFELKNGAYQYKELLNFVVPSINNEVGYQYLELRFSDRFFMTSISNLLYDFETGQSIPLNIPLNETFGFADLMNNLKGVNIIIKDIEAKYPNLLISYFSKDENGSVTNRVLNYDLSIKNIVGKFEIPEENARFFKPVPSRFGCFFWMPEKNNNDYMIYKKLF